MRDNLIFSTLISVINAGLVNRNVTDVVVQQAYQPTQQGIPTTKFIGIFKLFDEAFSWPGNVSYETDDGEETRYSQMMLSSFQISAWVTQIPNNSTELTSSDLCNLALMILQQDVAQDIFSLAQIGITLPSTIRNPYFLDDRDQNQASPSFDLQIQHENSEILSQDIITEIDFLLYRV